MHVINIQIEIHVLTQYDFLHQKVLQQISPLSEELSLFKQRQINLMLNEKESLAHRYWSGWSALCVAKRGENINFFYTICTCIIYMHVFESLPTCSFSAWDASGTTALNSVFKSVPAGIIPIGSESLTSASRPEATCIREREILCYNVQASINTTLPSHSLQNSSARGVISAKSMDYNTNAMIEPFINFPLHGPKSNPNPPY